MVLFDNVFSGQRVEVRWNDCIYKGTVRYKGPVATKNGDWVGVELDYPVGDTSGMMFGRRYFQCRPKYGVFVRADRIRFVQSVRCLYNKYHKVSNSSYVDEHLFNTPQPEVQNGPYDPVAVSNRGFQRVHSSLGDLNHDLEKINYSIMSWDKPKYYNLRHSVSNSIPAATMLRASTVGNPLRYSSSRPIHWDYWMDDDFERSPSIPKTHMPYSALKQQVKQGWNGAHYVREMTVPTGRQKMKFSQWNDTT